MCGVDVLEDGIEQSETPWLTMKKSKENLLCNATALESLLN